MNIVFISIQQKKSDAIEKIWNSFIYSNIFEIETVQTMQTKYFSSIDWKINYMTKNNTFRDVCHAVSKSVKFSKGLLQSISSYVLEMSFN